MRIHLVAHQWGDSERIIPRLARTLVQGLDCNVSAKPDPNADVNYGFPYLELPAGHWPETKTAAWFTHRDPTLKGKGQMWDDRAKRVDLRLCSAAIWLDELRQYGPTRLVTVPLDRDKFRPMIGKGGSRPIVGVSGYAYRGGRKGEHLVKQLIHAPLSKRFELRAAGRGWPVTTRAYRWDEMERFYQHLDIYLLPSLIEGIGYGPLEALSCGVKVVIPHGVGIMDELPAMPGIHHYERGDFEDMCRALAEALETRADPEALRAVTEGYSLQAWLDGHRRAFEELLELRPMVDIAPEPVPVNLPAWQDNSGVYVVAFGEPSRQCAVRCIESFKRHNPGIPVALCSDRALGPEDITIIQPEVDIGARVHKIRIYDLAPREWEYVLYLDADTETIAPLDSLFRWLQDGWELCICKNPGKYAIAANMGRKDSTTETQEVFQQWGTDQMMQWNGGVFSFRRCANIERLFGLWQSEWERWGKRDQGALLRVLWLNPVRALWLGNEWNLVPAYDPVERSAGIVHHPTTARRWEGIVYGRSDSPEAWRKVAQWEKQHLTGARR